MAVIIHHGDMRAVLPTLEARFHSVVTDPPYHLASIVKRFGADGAAPAKSNGATGAYERASRGFMGKQWDGGQIAFDPATWAAVGAVMRPGAHLVAFGGTKGFHRMACAIEDAGFEIRDTLAWLYGSGFPKSHNLAGEWQGYGTALKPAFEPIILARWPLIGTVAANLEAHGCGALNVEACRIETTDRLDQHGPQPDMRGGDYGAAAAIGRRLIRKKIGGPDVGGKKVFGAGLSPGSEAAGSTTLGRWPANVVHDGGEEVLAAFNGDSGNAARFFYSAKADSADRLESKHPTVKPVDLMRWLVRLVTPRGGLVLDPFAGSGTTAMACMAEGFDCHLVERETEYVADIRRRVAHVTGMDTPLFAV